MRDRRWRDRIRLLRDLVLEEGKLEVRYWAENLGTGNWVGELAAEMERMLVESVGWMQYLFVAGSWIPSLLKNMTQSGW